MRIQSSFYLCLLALWMAACATTPDTAAPAPTLPPPAANPVPANTMRTVDNPTALDRYVAAADDHFAYERVGVTEHGDVTAHIYHLTSQRWDTPEPVEPAIWTHYAVIAVPETVTSTTALMFIGGGSNNNDPPQGGGAYIRRLARLTGMICVELYQIPNQPLRFADGRGGSEDRAIAITWDLFLRTGNEMWPMRLPMTKAVVRAMDMTQEVMATPEAGQYRVDDFIVAGGSKRGWTVWTTAAVDSRVKAAIPMVIDLLNVVPSFEHHWEAYGHWAPAIGDYDRTGIMPWLKTPEFKALMELVDPYEYRERFTMPKLIMNGAGDQFFLPDSSQFYWDDLIGDKWLRYLPNAGHGLNATAVPSAAAFALDIALGNPIPEYSWAYSGPNTVRVTTNAEPSQVLLWTATNPEERTWRVDVVGINLYQSVPLEPIAPGVYEATVPDPPEGWTAWLIELTFPGPNEEADHIFTTPVSVVPPTMPFEYVQPPKPEGGFLE